MAVAREAERERDVRHSAAHIAEQLEGSGQSQSVAVTVHRRSRGPAERAAEVERGNLEPLGHVGELCRRAE
jgi:hypothetical protein